mmetsp:Transcript_10484/g.17611  ORF Transcript_10484/g.17611 Transcript_10484/m.17611 type:complete len:617 (-) Transcript_10484:1452-3302(-)
MHQHPCLRHVGIQKRPAYVDRHHKSHLVGSDRRADHHGGGGRGGGTQVVVQFFHLPVSPGHQSGLKLLEIPRRRVLVLHEHGGPQNGFPLRIVHAVHVDWVPYFLAQHLPQLRQHHWERELRFVSHRRAHTHGEGKFLVVPSRPTPQLHARIRLDFFDYPIGRQHGQSVSRLSPRGSRRSPERRQRSSRRGSFFLGDLRLGLQRNGLHWIFRRLVVLFRHLCVVCGNQLQRAFFEFWSLSSPRSPRPQLSSVCWTRHRHPWSVFRHVHPCCRSDTPNFCHRLSVRSLQWLEGGLLRLRALCIFLDRGSHVLQRRIISLLVAFLLRDRVEVVDHGIGHRQHRELLASDRSHGPEFQHSHASRDTSGRQKSDTPLSARLGAVVGVRFRRLHVFSEPAPHVDILVGLSSSILLERGDSIDTSSSGLQVDAGDAEQNAEHNEDLAHRKSERVFERAVPALYGLVRPLQLRHVLVRRCRLDGDLSQAQFRAHGFHRALAIAFDPEHRESSLRRDGQEQTDPVGHVLCSPVGQVVSQYEIQRQQKSRQKWNALDEENVHQHVLLLLHDLLHQLGLQYWLGRSLLGGPFHHDRAGSPDRVRPCCVVHRGLGVGDSSSDGRNHP